MYYRLSKSLMAKQSRTGKSRGRGAVTLSATRRHLTSKLRIQRPLWSGSLGMIAKPRGNTRVVAYTYVYVPLIEHNNVQCYCKYSLMILGKEGSSWLSTSHLPQWKKRRKPRELSWKRNITLPHVLYVNTDNKLLSIKPIYSNRSEWKLDLPMPRSNQSSRRLLKKRRRLGSSSRQSEVSSVKAARVRRAGAASVEVVERKGLVVVKGHKE